GGAGTRGGIVKHHGALLGRGAGGCRWGTTDIALFTDGSVVHTAALPVGATHVTNDIAIGLRTTLSEAEMLKVNYGHAIPACIPKEEMVELHTIRQDRVQVVPRRHLAALIAQRPREHLGVA